MKQFPFDQRYEIENANGEHAYYIEGDTYIRLQEGTPVYRIDSYEVYRHDGIGELVGFLEGERITGLDGEDLLVIVTA
ncbi:hypothetical protein BD65_499 [Yersinia ruckeri]|uniref:hypothetical protein n=1 Tax=Yersinia ruckeri TaxID=29486 RepID=UPI0005ABE91F|nr:hypothetical protein [Yersinia ruckeri]AJI94651.1 hypothetical protein BD65_499 [Yersinia ruckeri]MCW6568060.1 hypothetical protein [Yersinia ruckeri]